MALRISFALSPFCFSLSSFQYWSTYHHLLITSITLTISSSITWCVPTYLYISLMTKVSTLRFHQLFKTKLELSRVGIDPERIGHKGASGQSRTALGALWTRPGDASPTSGHFLAARPIRWCSRVSEPAIGRQRLLHLKRDTWRSSSDWMLQLDASSVHELHIRSISFSA
jgi:hypothetical protein